MHPYFASHLTSFVQPLGQARARASILHTIQDSSKKFLVSAQGRSVNYSMILLCLYIYLLE